MSTDGAVHRDVAPTMSDFLSRASSAPAALVVSGDAGIGKSTRWLAGVEQAHDCGFEVLSARPLAGESALAYAAVADLLSGVDPEVWSALPDPQRQALEGILLHSDGCDATSSRRAAATALLSVVHVLAESTPVLLAIDDLQWLDPASAAIFSFVTRRLRGPVGVLTTIRTGGDSSGPAVEVVMPTVTDINRITLAPLTLGAMHSVLTARLGHSLPRAALVSIHDVSGGNPLYALELAQATNGSTESLNTTLPGTLTDVVRTRLGSLDRRVRRALFAAAAVEAPTVEMVAHALSTTSVTVMGLLEVAENAGIVRIDGHRLRFAHPLLARGVYSSASPAARRRMHQSLAAITVEPESRARHLALATVNADPQIVRMLDSAAESARLRGAQATAAELLDLALGLGGDTPDRRIRSARCHFAAGDVGQARGLLEQSISGLPPGARRAQALGVLAGVSMMDDGFAAASKLLRQGLAEAGEDRAASVSMLVAQAFAELNTGDTDAATGTAEAAIAAAAELGDATLLSQSLAMRPLLAMLRGDGLDESAMPVHDSAADFETPFTTTMSHALAAAWSGELERARNDVAALHARCRRGGYEHGQLYLEFHAASIELWRSNFPAASAICTDATERAQQLGGDVPLAMVATLQASIDSYAGKVVAARRGGRTALELAHRCSGHWLWRSAVTNLAFLESSLGNHRCVVELVAPLLEADTRVPYATEIATAAYLPDAVEALVNLERLDEAEALVNRLERNGRRLDRPWMLAVGGRCRAMIEAARGELDAANHAAEQALAQHDRLPMPFERARTQLVLGQLQRRQRRKDTAASTLAAAGAVFETLDTPIWADRARAELARCNTGAHRGTVLTPSEHAVAELVSTGMINRDVAAALFISPKTVEANLARIYRKLSIHSRAELSRHMCQLEGIPGKFAVVR